MSNIMKYKEDRKLADNTIELIKPILGACLIEESSFEVDTKQATDLIVLTGKSYTIGCRVRRSGYFNQYPDEFTIRVRRDSGAKTEFEKVMAGWGDLFFYGHLNPEHTAIPYWYLINYHSFRHQWTHHKDTLTYIDKSNEDGTYFRAFNLLSFLQEPPILLNSSFPQKYGTPCNYWTENKLTAREQAFEYLQNINNGVQEVYINVNQISINTQHIQCMGQDLQTIKHLLACLVQDKTGQLPLLLQKSFLK